MPAEREHQTHAQEEAGGGHHNQLQVSNQLSQVPTVAGTPALSLEQSYQSAKWVTQRSKSNFALSFLLLPKQQRKAMYALYAFFRVADDLADARSDDSIQQLHELSEAVAALNDVRERSKSAFHQNGRSVIPAEQPSAYDHPASFHARWPWWNALADTVHRYDIKTVWLQDLLTGVGCDLGSVHIKSAEELDHYCYQVASTVGLCCMKVWGAVDPAHEPYSIAMGQALQRINILRDIVEDAKLGRCYLPADQLAEHGITLNQLIAFKQSQVKPTGEQIKSSRTDATSEQPSGMLSCSVDESPRQKLHNFMSAQIAYADLLLIRGRQADQYLPSAGRAIFHSISGVYAELLGQMKADPLAPLKTRLRVPKHRKLMQLLWAMPRRFGLWR